MNWKLFIEIITGTIGFLMFYAAVDEPNDKDADARLLCGIILIALCLALIFG